MPYSFSALNASSRDWMASPAGPDQAFQNVTFTPPSVFASASITETGAGVAVASLVGGGKSVAAGVLVKTVLWVPWAGVMVGVASQAAKVRTSIRTTFEKGDRISGVNFEITVRLAHRSW